MKLSTSLFPWILLAPAIGQGPEPSPLLAEWFRLPPEPYDYTTTAAPQGLDVALLTPRNTRLTNPITNDGATLGRVLFYDKRLSRNQKTSCASCHKQSRAFADFRSKSRGLRGRLTRRNSMPLVNLQFHPSRQFFWDQRARTLEETVLMPIQDPVEMDMDLHSLVTRLQKDTGYLDLFRRAFGTPKVTSDRIGKALAQFVRAMASFRSKFDQGYAMVAFFRDPFPNFSKQQNRGKALFLRACASCHMRETQRGMVRAPVIFQGVQAACNGVDRGLKRDDQGVAGVTKNPRDAGKFRIPSLRNIELTAPYMHDGRFASLDMVVSFYAQKVHDHPNLDSRLIGRGRTGWGMPMPRCEPVTPGGRGPTTGRRNEPIGFPMTRRDRGALVAFLRTLTDRQFTKDPRFADPFRAGLPRR